MSDRGIVCYLTAQLMCFVHSFELKNMIILFAIPIVSVSMCHGIIIETTKILCGQLNVQCTTC